MTIGVVKPYGKLNSPILWIGEAPGEEEVKQGKPFVGASGKMARRALSRNGIDHEGDVLWANTAWVNPGTFPKGMSGVNLLKVWAPAVDEILEAATPKVVVACGAVALLRLTGLTGIDDWCNSVIPNEYLPDMMTWYQTKTITIGHPVKLPPNVLVIPILHPAGILHDPTRSLIRLFERGVEKVAMAAKGEMKPLEKEFHFHPHPMEVAEAFKDAEWVYLDTEFNPETQQIFWIGMTCNGRDVWGMPWAQMYQGVIKEILENERTVKAAHNALADVRVLEHAGVRVRGKIECTMLRMYCLHPGWDVGLSPTSRYYLDHVMHRKWMSRDDPEYNAYDVLYGALSREKQKEEMATKMVDIADEIEARERLLPVVRLMEDRGMLVDQERRKELLEECDAKVENFLQMVEDTVKPLVDTRSRHFLQEVHKQEQEIARLKAYQPGWCKKHKYNGTAGKPPSCEDCRTFAKTVEAERLRYDYGIAKQRLKLAKRELALLDAGGFNPKSPKHLAWLLYDPNALGLPIQRAKMTKKMTTNKGAIDRLSKVKSVKHNQYAMAAVTAIKEIQSLEKAISTFIKVPVDANGYAHPPYKIHGTVTGRLAGGEDKKGETDKVWSGMAYNAMNIPEKWRHMYCAPPGYMFVSVDVSNQEGRCVAYYSGDGNYLRQFAEELHGGPKVHSLNASIIYGIDPKDAKDVMVKFKGDDRAAYEAGKAATHAWSYSLDAVPTLIENYGLTLEEAIRIDEALTAARPKVAAYKGELVREVCGAYEVDERFTRRRAVQVEGGRGWLSNAFGWTLEFLGVGMVRKNPRTGDYRAVPVQANEVLAFPPQSTGASTWSRCARTVHDACVELGWPGVWTGTYDSLLVCVPDGLRERDEARSLLESVFTQKWPQMNGYWFPVEAKWGYNWGSYNTNPSRGRLNERGMRNEW